MPMSDSTNRRKIEHIEVIEADREVDRGKLYFDDIMLSHRALPEIDLAAIDTGTRFLGKHLSFPLLISSMTGGDHDLLRTINRNLAEAAEATGVALAVGSQRVMFTHPDARSSFELRTCAPTTALVANVGAIQLNNGFTVNECKEAVSVLEADGLYLHLNPLQEAVQPEGTTNFAGLGEKIGEVTAALDEPVLLKEVGAGISAKDVELAIRHGVRYIDVAGTGGTSWSRIEHHRRKNKKDDLGLLFQDWGLPTPLALKALAPYRDRVTLVASGGLRSGLDMAKAIVLGASLCGLAAPFLKPAAESAAAVVAAIERLRREFTTAMFLTGTGRLEDLKGNGDLLL
jgi:isopentenyl-diphosphate delta-isomerase